MELNFLYTRKEWIQGYRQFQFLMKRVTRPQLAVQAVCPFLLAALYMDQRSQIAATVVFTVWILSVVLTVFVMLIQPQLLYKKTEKYHQAYRLVFSKEGIQFDTKDISSQLGWDVYNGYFENRDYFYLLQGKVSYLLLPKRAFGKEEDIEKFRRLLCEKYKQ